MIPDDGETTGRPCTALIGHLQSELAELQRLIHEIEASLIHIRLGRPVPRDLLIGLQSIDRLTQRLEGLRHFAQDAGAALAEGATAPAASSAHERHIAASWPDTAAPHSETAPSVVAIGGVRWL